MTDPWVGEQLAALGLTRFNPREPRGPHTGEWVKVGAAGFLHGLSVVGRRRDGSHVRGQYHDPSKSVLQQGAGGPKTAVTHVRPAEPGSTSAAYAKWRRENLLPMTRFNPREARDPHSGKWVTADYAGHLDGRTVHAKTLYGKDIHGTYDHQAGTVTTRLGRKHAVSRIEEPAGNTPAAKPPAAGTAAYQKWRRGNLLPTGPGPIKTEGAVSDYTARRTAETATALTVPEPIGKPGGPGLFHIKGLGLPPYIQHVRDDLMEKGVPESRATGMAVGIVRNWSEGHDGKGHKVSAEVQAAAAKNIAQWEADKARTAHGAKRSLTAEARNTDMAGTELYDADGLDASWDGSHDDLPDLDGLDVEDFETAAGDEPGTVSRAAKLGTGARFAALKSSLAAKGASNPGALAAFIGRKKFGKQKFHKLASAARKRKGGGPAAMASRSMEIFRYWPLEECRIMRAAEGREYESGRVVEAYAAVFNTPAEIKDHEGHYEEEIDPGAFSQVLRAIHPDRNNGYWNTTCLYNHGMTVFGTPAERFSLPAGVPRHVAAEGKGLLTRTEYAATPLGEELLELVNMGALRSQSFTGGIVRSDPALKHPGDRYRKAYGGALQRVRRLVLGLREYGLTPFAAYSGAEVMGVRMQLPGGLDFEEFDDLEDGPAEKPMTRQSSPGRMATASRIPTKREPCHGPPETGCTSSAPRSCWHSTASRCPSAARKSKGVLPMRLQEMLDRQSAIRNELASMDADPSVTEEGDGNIRDTLIDEYESLERLKEPVISRMEKIKLIQRSADNPANRDDYDGPATSAARRWDGGQTPEFMSRLDPFAELDKVRDGLVRGSDMVARSMNVIEMHAKRGMLLADRAEEATRKCASDPMIARHALLTGHDEYVEAFRAYVNDPQGDGLRMAQRSLTLGTASGGYLLPYVLDPTIVITSDGSTNPYRAMADIKQTTSNAWQGVNSAGVQMGWLDEGGQSSDQTPATGQIQIFVKKAAAWVIGSFESVGDTNFADQLPRLLADSKDILEETAFARGTGGTGNSGQPLGVLNSLGTAQRVLAGGSGVAAFTGTLGSGGANNGGLGDVMALNGALGPRFRMSPSVGWVATITNINKIRILDQYGGAGFWANLGQGTPPTLMEKQIRESPSLTQTPGTGTALAAAAGIFGDWSKFYVVDRIGSTMLFDPLIKGAGTANMPTGNQGWFYYWRVGSGVATPNAFRWASGGTA